MISNTAQINTFIGGLNLDQDVNLIPDNQYRHAEDVRVVTNDGGTTGVLQSIENPRKYGTVIPKDETIIGTTTINDIGVVITKLEDGTNKIYRLMGFDGNMPQIKLVCKGSLGLCEDLSKTPTLSIVGNYESETTVKIYFTDGKSPVKTINIMSNKYTLGSDLVDENGNIINPGTLELTPSVPLTPLKFIKLSDGSLNSGMVTYCYQLFNVHGTETVTSPLSELIHLTASTSNQGSQEYKGTGLDKPANKAVTLTTDLSVKDFDKFRIIRIQYSQNNSTPSISIVDEVDIASDQTEIRYTDYGSSFLSELSVDEFNALTGYQFLAQTLAKMQNRLFAANITEQSWIPKDEDGEIYDARAYRANSTGAIRLQSASDSRMLLLDVNNDDLLYKVPQDHDCINPFNIANFNECPEDSKYMYGKDGKLGGYGINIEYSFITTDIKLSKQQGQFRLDQDCTMDVPAEKVSAVYIDKQDGSSDMYVNGSEELEDFRTPNYADPYIDANFRGYQRDEIYRFGIVFYNEKSIASPVLWIGDIRMPRSSQMPPFVYENNTLIGKALGVEFKVKNMPADAVSYEIVRCDRTEADRTVIMQTVGSLVYEYRIQEQDKEFGKGSELDSSIEMRPLPFFSSILNNMYISSDSNDKSQTYLSQLCHDYIRLVSPEICIQGEDIESLLKNNCYLDIQGVYYSPIKGGRTSPKALATSVDYSPFATANYMLQPDGSIKYQDTVTYLGYDNNDKLNVVLPYRNTEGQTVYYQPIIAKYFVPYFESASNYDRVEIADAKYPPNIDYNLTIGVTANRINVGERTYTNYSMSDFTTHDNQAINGPAGPCIIAYTPNLNNVFPGFNGVADSRLNSYDAFNAIPVFNIRKTSPVQYGGNTFSSRQNSVYITTNTFNENYVFGGDTYLSLLDYPNTMIFQTAELEYWEARKFFVGSYIPFESSINMNLLQGDQAHRTHNSSNYLDSYLQLNPTQMGQWHSQDLPYFMYNSVYSAQNGGKFYVPNSIYAEENVKYSNRILSSQAKTNNEVIDQWSKFKVADYLDVDNQWGSITNLKVFKDRLFYFQDTGVGIAAVNERSLITDDNVNQLVLGTGGILSRFDYVTTTNGSSVNNDKSIVNSDNVLYWYDTDKNEICSYTGQVSQLSKEKQVQSYFNKNIKEDRTKGMSLFDKKYNEVWFNILNKPLIFNEQLGRFTSFYTFNPKWSLPISDRVVAIMDNNLHTLHDTGVIGLEPLDRKAKLEIVINKDAPYTKVFDNVRLQGEFKDGNQETLRDDIIDYMKFSTKHQEAVREHTEEELDEEGNVVTPEQHIVTDYREDTFRFPVPRADKNEDKLSLPARLRGKYMICDYDLDSDIDHTFEIPQITTTYRHSLI